MTTITKATALLVAALTVTASVPAHAQRLRGRVGMWPRGYFYAPLYDDPFWWPYGMYAPYAGRQGADVKVDVTPKQAEVFVDGYYAGVADDFDGAFKSLRTSPGGHVITLHLEGYRTLTENIYVRLGSTFKLRESMDRLPAGETSAPVPPPVRSESENPDRR